MSVTVKSPKTERDYELEFAVGKNLQEAVELFTEEVVFNKFATQTITDIGNAVRKLMNDGKSDDEIVEFIAGWKPGVRKVGGGKKKETAKTLAARYKDPSISPEEKAKVRAKLETLIKEAQEAAAEL